MIRAGSREAQAVRVQMMADASNKSISSTALRMWRDGGLPGLFKGTREPRKCLCHYVSAPSVEEFGVRKAPDVCRNDMVLVTWRFP